MKGNPNAKAMVLLISHGVWAFLFAIWNDFFAFGPIYFYLGGIFAILPAIRLDFSRGFLCAVVIGCFLDAALPTPFGFHACGLAIAQVVLRSTNERTSIHRRQTLILATLIMNLFLFLALHLWFSIQVPNGAEILHGRAFADLVFSELLIAFTLPWLIELHDDFLRITGIEPSGKPISAT